MTTQHQYISPTNGAPLRGLIQDHVCSGVKLTSKDCFLNREMVMELVYVALSGMPRVEIIPSDIDIKLVPPAIFKPKPLWTGKQVSLHFFCKDNV